MKSLKEEEEEEEEGCGGVNYLFESQLHFFVSEELLRWSHSTVFLSSQVFFSLFDTQPAAGKHI